MYAGMKAGMAASSVRNRSTFGGRKMTFPTTAATIARTDAAQTFTGNQTYNIIVVNNSVASGTAGSTATPVFRSGSSGVYFTGTTEVNVSVNGTIALSILPSSLSIGSLSDAILTRSASANLQQGAADSAAPVAQTFSAQSVVAGTTNTAGVLRKITGSQGTGAGAGGDVEIWGAPAGSTGSAQNALQRIVGFANTLVSTFYGLLVTVASTTASAGFRLTPGTSPTSPVNGDMWQDGTTFKIRINGVTKTVTVT